MSLLKLVRSWYLPSYIFRNINFFRNTISSATSSGNFGKECFLIFPIFVTSLFWKKKMHDFVNDRLFGVDFKMEMLQTNSNCLILVPKRAKKIVWRVWLESVSTAVINWFAKKFHCWRGCQIVLETFPFAEKSKNFERKNLPFTCTYMHKERRSYFSPNLIYIKSRKFLWKATN